MATSTIIGIGYFFQRLYNIGNKNLSYTLMFIVSITSLDHQILSQIFGHLYHMSILNIALIVQLANEDIVLVTYYPFTPTHCHSTRPVVINSYDAASQQWIHSNFFPSKLDNFHGCPLTCATWEQMPYLMLSFNRTTQCVIKYEGFEGKLLEFAASQMNFTPKIYSLSKEDINGTYNETYSIFGKILSQYADFAIGAFYYNANNNSVPYTQTVLYYLTEIFLVTNEFGVYTTYDKLAQPFQSRLWLTILVVFALSSTLICACSVSQRTRRQRNLIIGYKNKTPHYHLYTLALGGVISSGQLPRYNLARLLFTCWVLSTLVLRSGYQSGMYQMLRDNKQWHLPQTIADVLQQNYEIFVSAAQARVADILPRVNLRDLADNTLEQYTNRLQSNERIAHVTPYEYFAYLAKVNISLWQRLHLVNERIFTQQLVINVRRNSYLVHELNAQLANAQYYGYINRWAREYFRLAPSHRKEHRTTSPSNILSMHELGALFMILLWLHLIATIVCIIEIMWHMLRPNVCRIWTKYCKLARA